MRMKWNNTPSPGQYTHTQAPPSWVQFSLGTSCRHEKSLSQLPVIPCTAISGARYQLLYRLPDQYACLSSQSTRRDAAIDLVEGRW